jgi:hypothetical protein
MSKTIEMPEDLFAHLDRAAAAKGLTPRVWMDEKLPQALIGSAGVDGEPKTLADLFAGRVGLFSSGSGEPRLETLRESFADHLEEKHRDGRL